MAKRAVDGTILFDGIDLNTATISGMYRCSGDNPHNPSSTGYGQMLVIHGGLDTIAQFYCPYDHTAAFVRTGVPPEIGGGGEWNDWAELAQCIAPEVHEFPFASGARNSQYSTSQYFKSQESVVTLNVWAVALLNVGTLIGTLPEGYRPRTNQACGIFVVTTKYGAYSPAEIVVQTDGKVYCYGSALDGSEFELGFSISFIAAS